MSAFRTRSCSCSACKSACENRPGWPTPQEAERIIAAGMADRLMLDWWEGDEQQPYTEILCPAAPGCGGRDAPEIDFLNMFGPGWRCTFLKNGKCELHGTSMKPFECRVTMVCKDVPGNSGAHAAAAKKWNTPKGKEVVLLWRANVNEET